MPEKKPNIIIDFLKEGDNDALLDLSHRCVQHGVLSVYPDRSPSFNRIHKEVDQDCFHVVGRHADKIIGCFGGIHSPLQHNGKKYNSIYVLDFKVDPDYQKGLTAFRLTRKAYDKFFLNRGLIGLATIIKGNNASHIFTRGRAGFPKSNNLGDIQVINIIPLLRKKVDSSYNIEHPTEEDIGELVSLYTRFYQGYKLGPYISENLLKYYLDKIEGIDLDNMWVARQNGKIKAVLCAWDENVYKRWRVLRVPFGMKMLMTAIRFLSIFMKMPAAIRMGESLRQKTLVMMAHDDDTEALKSLIRHVNNIHMGTEYTALQAHIHKEDPMMNSLKGLIGLKVDIELHMMLNDNELANSICSRPGPVLLEWPMFI